MMSYLLECLTDLTINLAWLVVNQSHYEWSERADLVERQLKALESIRYLHRADVITVGPLPEWPTH